MNFNFSIHINETFEEDDKSRFFSKLVELNSAEQISKSY